MSAESCPSKMIFSRRLFATKSGGGVHVGGWVGVGTTDKSKEVQQLHDRVYGI